MVIIDSRYLKNCSIRLVKPLSLYLQNVYNLQNTLYPKILGGRLEECDLVNKG